LAVSPRQGRASSAVMLRSPFQIVAKQITPWHLVGVEHADGQLRLAGTVIGMYELAMQPWRSHALTMKFSTRLYSGNIETIPQQDSMPVFMSTRRVRVTLNLRQVFELSMSRKWRKMADLKERKRRRRPSHVRRRCQYVAVCRIKVCWYQARRLNLLAISRINP